MLVFVGVTALLSAVFYGFIVLTGHVGGGNGAYELGLMWSPAVAALIACRLSGRSLASLGWRWGAWRWQWLAFLIPLAYAAVAYGTVWLTGLGGFPEPSFVASTRASLGWTGAPNAVVIGGYLLLIATAGMPMSLAFALGEEIGWRGFLSPQLTARFGLGAGGILTGLIWAAWHLPLVFFADYHAGSPLWFGVSCFVVLMAAMSVIMAWLRIRSGSLWTAAIFHASHNQFIQVFFTPITHPRGGLTAYAIDEFGFVLPLVVLVLAAVVWRLTTRQPTAKL